MSPQHTSVRFGPELIKLDARAESWRDAVRQAGAVLSANGVTAEGYDARMIRTIETFGPYVVVAPGVALVHARPEADVRANAAALVTFPGGVTFGHTENDPVRVVIALATTRPEDHVKVIAALARTIDSGRAVEWVLEHDSAAALANDIIDEVNPLNVLDASGEPARRVR